MRMSKIQSMRMAGNSLNFLSLKDAYKYVKRKVNVIAIVIETGFAKQTCGTDHCCVIRIIDDTHHDLGLTVNFFAKNTESLPLVAVVGDIIQLCRVAVTAYDKDVIAVFNKTYSSFALYKGKDGDDLEPYQVSSTFHPINGEKVLIDKLRKWLVNFQLHEDSSKFPMFREIKEETYTNLTVKILHLSEPPKDEEWLIYAWDGTDTEPNAIFSNLEDELKHPLPLQVETLGLPREILCTFPTVGSILRITFEPEVDMSHRYCHLLYVGKWVKFTNLCLKVHAGLWHGVFTRKTKLRYTPDEDQLIVERQRLLDERLSMSYSGFPEPSLITVNHMNHITPVTLMSVITHSKVTAIFRCVVRVVAALPCQAESLCSAAGVYRMRLTLEDSTARIYAYVFGVDGVSLFDGYPGVEKLKIKLDRLLGLFEHGRRNPPRVSVCLKSYYLSRDNIWDSRTFGVFDTKILEDGCIIK